ncbi:hypothetical protein J2S74_002760 [Evansella vedderi]|uniref:Sporulation protein n=1 Tax=Evansella vedderi TaxID=38282 RepID=A0ABT9ZVW7_9BACI|nr:DUF1360 domain-containing protein [Evansella vedderi]MDQ0255378.1 hypothetical protein [Evansella vedderi]
MPIETFHFVLFALAVFRLTHLLIYDTITESIREKFIHYENEKASDGTVETVLVIADKGWRKWIGELLTCHWCLGIWSSAFLLIGYLSFPFTFSIIIFILAAAGVAAILESFVIRYLD